MSFNSEPVWRALKHVSGEKPPPQLLFWLMDAESLTKRMRTLCGERFRVALLQQNWQRPMRSERIALNMTERGVGLIRQVHLMCGDRPTVFARTVIPRTTLRGKQRRLAQLGSKPLGEMLFSEKSMRRGEVQIAAITVGQRLFSQALADGGKGVTSIWGRRSVFWLDNKPLLVSEIFLPALDVALQKQVT